MSHFTDEGNFSPLFGFCEMHHDKLIDGANPFGPAGVGVKCKAFLWSKLDAPEYTYAFIRERLEIRDLNIEDVEPPEHIVLDRFYPRQECDGYYLYVFRQMPEPKRTTDAATKEKMKDE